MISKMKPVTSDGTGGSRLAIVFSGSPLFSGGAGQRRERDPPLDHRERLARSRRRPARPVVLQHRHHHLLLGRHQPQGRPSARARSSSSTPASECAKMRKSLGDKRKYLTDDQIAEITRLYHDALDRGTTTTASRSSTTRTSATSASPSNGPCAAAGTSPTRPSRPSRRASRARPWPTLQGPPQIRPQPSM